MGKRLKKVERSTVSSALQQDDDTYDKKQNEEGEHICAVCFGRKVYCNLSFRPGYV